MPTVSTTTPIKRVTRAKKVAEETPGTEILPTPVTKPKATPLSDEFITLIQTITATKDIFEKLQKEIAETRTSWEKEQRDHELALAEKNQQEETIRRREQESYEYETKLSRKKSEDEFVMQKTQWERELQQNKETIEQERKELDLLRKQVAGFEQEKDRAVKDASASVQKDLTSHFETEKKLREQEIKGEKAILELRITTFTQEVARQKTEIEALKQSLTSTTTQLKDVAVRVIDANKPTIIKSSPSFSDEE